VEYQSFRKLDPVGVCGGAFGCAMGYFFESFIHILAPIAAAALIALTFNHFDSRIKARFGSAGAAGLTALAFVLDPIQNLARGAVRGVLSLFAIFLLSLLGYRFAIEIHSRRTASADDADDD
jgi:hypothetical protein